MPYWAVQPPSMGSTPPVMEAASSEHSNAVKAATCSTVTNLGVMCTINFDLLLPGLTRCQDGNAALELSFQEGNLEALTDALDRGDIDLGVMCSPNEIAKRFAAQPLFREDYVVAFGDDHRFVGRAAVQLKELDREHYCERTNCEFTHHIGRILSGRDVHVQVVQSSHREDWIQAFVRANMGVAFMPISMAQAAQLPYVHTADCPIPRDVQVLRQSERPLTPLQQAALDSLTAYPWDETPALTKLPAEPVLQ